MRKMPHDVLYKLNLYLFFVDKKGLVEKFDWKALENLGN